MRWERKKQLGLALWRWTVVLLVNVLVVLVVWEGWGPWAEKRPLGTKAAASLFDDTGPQASCGPWPEIDSPVLAAWALAMARFLIMR